jgi:hypothetical protein
VKPPVTAHQHTFAARMQLFTACSSRSHPHTEASEHGKPQLGGRCSRRTTQPMATESSYRLQNPLRPQLRAGFRLESAFRGLKRHVRRPQRSPAVCSEGSRVDAVALYPLSTAFQGPPSQFSCMQLYFFFFPLHISYGNNEDWGMYSGNRRLAVRYVKT